MEGLGLWEQGIRDLVILENRLADNRLQEQWTYYVCFYLMKK